MDKFRELKAAAMAATPGPWGINRTGNTIVSNQSHPVATVSDAFHRQLAGGGVGKDAEFISAANPAAVLALLAELEFEKQNNAGVAGMVEDYETKLEAKDKRIAELERILDGVTPVMIAGGWTAKGISDYAKSLEAKLATPVRLQSPWVDKAGNRWLLEGTTADVIRAAGFAVTVEGDE